MAGCGGGSTTVPEATNPPVILNVTLTPTPATFITLGATGSRIPVLTSSNGSLNINAQITDVTGIDTNKPPTFTIYRDNNDLFTLFGPLPLTKVAGQTDQWSYDLSFKATPAGSLSGIFIVSISATNLRGVSTTKPVGLFYYSNL